MGSFMLEKYMVRTSGFIWIVLFRRRYGPLQGDTELKLAVGMANLHVHTVYSDKQDSLIVLKKKIWWVFCSAY